MEIMNVGDGIDDASRSKNVSVFGKKSRSVFRGREKEIEAMGKFNSMFLKGSRTIAFRCFKKDGRGKYTHEMILDLCFLTLK